MKTTANPLSSLIDSVEKIQQELQEATCEDLLDFWWVANCLLTRWRHPATLANPLQAAHHARVVLWMQQILFSKRTQPLSTKGVFRDLTAMTNSVESALLGSQEFRADAEAEFALLHARLELMQLAPGIENHDLTALASDLEEIMTANEPGQLWPQAPTKLIISFEAIVDAMERDVQTENLAPITAVVSVGMDQTDEIPDLMDF